MWDQVSLLRFYVDDKATDPDKLFSDPELQEFIDANPDDLHTVAADIWGIKAARVSEWYLAQTDGSLLARQQVFDHCLKMQDYHRGQGSSIIVSVLMDGGSRGTEDSSEF